MLPEQGNVLRLVLPVVTPTKTGGVKRNTEYQQPFPLRRMETLLHRHPMLVVLDIARKITTFRTPDAFNTCSQTTASVDCNTEATAMNSTLSDIQGRLPLLPGKVTQFKKS